MSIDFLRSYFWYRSALARLAEESVRVN